VAGFTHALMTGDHHILDQPVQVVAYTYSGEGVRITLTLSRHQAESGRTVYLARLQPSR
jgi:hypothetical protein